MLNKIFCLEPTFCCNFLLTEVFSLQTCFFLIFFYISSFKTNRCHAFAFQPRTLKKASFKSSKKSEFSHSPLQLSAAAFSPLCVYQTLHGQEYCPLRHNWRCVVNACILSCLQVFVCNEAHYKILHNVFWNH